MMLDVGWLVKLCKISLANKIRFSPLPRYYGSAYRIQDSGAIEALPNQTLVGPSCTKGT